jgi:hypothetical protein
MAQKPP